MNYGTLVITDGVPSSVANRDEGDFRLRGGMVRLNGALAPPPRPIPKSGNTTFTVELNYTDSVYSYGSGPRGYATELFVAYSRNYKRLASGGNPIKDAKNFVAGFAGCEEAHKLRGRAIALSRIRKSISGEVFRFPLEEP